MKNSLTIIEKKWERKTDIMKSNNDKGWESYAKATIIKWNQYENESRKKKIYGFDTSLTQFILFPNEKVEKHFSFAFKTRLGQVKEWPKGIPHFIS